MNLRLATNTLSRPRSACKSDCKQQLEQDMLGTQSPNHWI